MLVVTGAFDIIGSFVSEFIDVSPVFNKV